MFPSVVLSSVSEISLIYSVTYLTETKTKAAILFNSYVIIDLLQHWFDKPYSEICFQITWLK